MKTLLIVLAMVMMSSVAMANGYQCPPPPCPECQPAQVTCQCDCTGGTVLPGLYKVNIGGIIRCGEITVIENGFLFEEHGASVGTSQPPIAKIFFLSNAWKRAKQVQSCE